MRRVTADPRFGTLRLENCYFEIVWHEVWVTLHYTCWCVSTAAWRFTDGLLMVFSRSQILTSMSKSVSKIWGDVIRIGVEQSSNWALKSLFEGPKWRPGCDFGTQGCFLKSSGGFAERFFSPIVGTVFVVLWFLESCFKSFWMLFLGCDFSMKIIDFLKSVVLPKREHHFWRSGGDLEGLWDGQNRPKVVSERVKKGPTFGGQKGSKNEDF